MAVFTDLPRELRQNILRYVFEDAAQKDQNLNGHLRHDFLQCTTSSNLLVAMNIRSYTFANIAHASNNRETTLQFIRGTLPEIQNSRAHKESQEEYFAPHIEEQATKLLAAFPNHKDDVLYVLDKVLNYLRELVEGEDRTIALELEKLPNGIAANSARRGWFVGCSRLGAGYAGIRLDWNMTMYSPEEE